MMDTFNFGNEHEYVVKSEVSDDIIPPNCNFLEDERFPDFSLLKNNQTISESSASSQGNDSCDEQALSSNLNTANMSLPPRKRAKTDEEKEIRRQERIMRNRHAAHVSREKKRQQMITLQQDNEDLQSEVKKLRSIVETQNMFKLRAQQLETAIMMAQRSGDWASLNDVLNQPPIDDYFNRVNESSRDSEQPTFMLTTSDEDMNSNNGYSESSSHYSTNGSPAPSLIDDCASPDALVIKAEEVEFLPLSPEKYAQDTEIDIYGHTTFGFDSNPTASADTLTFSQSSSKSRHSAAMTPLLGNYFSTQTVF